MTRKNNQKVLIGLASLLLILLLVLSFGCSKVLKISEKELDYSEDTVSQTIEVIIPKDEVKTSITNEYILPASEFQGTKTEPDIIHLENNYISVSLVPNRGRIIFDYNFKPTGNSEIYSSNSPRPLKVFNDYNLEFGGFYLSCPWNSRDRQPYEMEYEILKEGPETAQVYLWREDPENLLLGEIWVTVNLNSSLVEIKTKLSNKTEKTINFDFNDYIFMTPGGGFSDNSSLLIPAEKIKIEKSKDNWMGEEGSIVAWPQNWLEWSKFEHFGIFSVEKNDLLGNYIASVNKNTGDAFIKTWEPEGLFSSIKIWSFGNDYTETNGAEPTVNFENHAYDLSIKPGEAMEMITYIYAMKGLDNIKNADQYFAGNIIADKDNYIIKTDKFVNIEFQIGSNSVREDLTKKILLKDQKNNQVWELDNEKLSVLTPAIIDKGSLQVDMEKTKIISGEYVIKLELLNDSGDVVFEIESQKIKIQ